MKADRDFARELADLQEALTTAQQELARYQGAKAALGSQKAEIVKLCTQLGVEPKREAVQAALDATEAELERELAAADKLLRKVEK